jgi:hypothetical protein
MAIYLILATQGSAEAWELSTHARLTKQAYLHSKLGVSEEEVQLLGLRKELDLEGVYFDVSGAEVEGRMASEVNRPGNRGGCLV